MEVHSWVQTQNKCPNFTEHDTDSQSLPNDSAHHSLDNKPDETQSNTAKTTNRMYIREEIQPCCEDQPIETLRPHSQAPNIVSKKYFSFKKLNTISDEYYIFS